MNPTNKQIIVDNARNYLDQGWHCSEGILKAMGEYYFPDQLPDLLTLAAPFSGGVGGTREGLCGAMSGGLMVIGALHGRTDAGSNDDHCIALSVEFRDKFIRHFGFERCSDLRERWVGKPGQLNCAELTAQAASLLLDILEK